MATGCFDKGKGTNGKTFNKKPLKDIENTFSRHDFLLLQTNPKTDRKNFASLLNRITALLKWI
jgi:hypothetical protein